MNSFFVRHVANPKRMKLIHGLNNAHICAVNDDTSIIPYDKSNNTQLTFPPNNFNQSLLQTINTSSILPPQSPNLLIRRKEKAMPPHGIWRTHGLGIFFSNFC